eukprot:6667473-Pyramimonas_sp.AAC.1
MPSAAVKTLALLSRTREARVWWRSAELWMHLVEALIQSGLSLDRRSMQTDSQDGLGTMY